MARPTTMICSRGDAVQTSLGKGVVQDVRNNGRLLVDLRGRAVEVAAASVTRREGERVSKTRTAAGSTSSVAASRGARPTAPETGWFRVRGVNLEDLAAQALGHDAGR